MDSIHGCIGERLNERLIQPHNCEALTEHPLYVFRTTTSCNIWRASILDSYHILKIYQMPLEIS